MSDKSQISWTDATWIPVTGCTRVSPGCDHCYAFQLHDQRHVAFKRGRWPTAPQQYHQPFSRVQLLEERLTQPLRWKEGRRIFVTSMGDLFHEDVPDEFLAECYGVMAVCSAPFHGRGDGVRITEGKWRWPVHGHGPHVFQVLTKRPKRRRELLNSDRFRGMVASAAHRWAQNRRTAGQLSDSIESGALWPLPNCWEGTSVENQERADERIPDLLATPAAVRFLSCEPLLGPVALGTACARSTLWNPPSWHPRTGARLGHAASLLDWVIIGGESGPRFRPMETEWALDLKRQCDAAGVAVWAKQGSGRKSEQPFGHPELDGARAFPSAEGVAS